MGSSASKAALAATTEEPMEPGPKHLADLTQYINETHMSVAHLADILSKKTGSSSWVVVFKALVTVHHLMVHGNERFIRHLAARHSLFTLHNFLDKSVGEGYAMSIFIRRYSRYLNERSLAYRQIACDITKVKRGASGVMRNMDTDRLLHTLPVIQTQLDALLSFAADPDELRNGIVRAAFRLLLKDSLRLFAAYNEGMLNLLGKYFDMRRSQCRESLELYAKFLARTAKLTRFLRVAEQVGIDRNSIPHLTQAPCSLLEALQQHLASLEEKKDFLCPCGLQHTVTLSIPYRPTGNACARRTWFAAHKPAGAEQQNTDLNVGEKPSNKASIETDASGGTNWQLSTCASTSAIWTSVSGPPSPHTVTSTMAFPPLMSPQSLVSSPPGLMADELELTAWAGQQSQSM
ncbi:phosphatidylinositol-binding clathrin assembly protein-like isoform X2 [Talpa occidentalis]|uniref:phosphatidylinositol-binding clathrin assembly protein-like isoform X2 n=1 Tax=Talpa occidentalis TaxID=50954 RepID=UPI00188DE1E7|nr:phosphatidylinositol-binding clathrin assembly protein-like isoform X2 [Talpa occidentalis]